MVLRRLVFKRLALAVVLTLFSVWLGNDVLAAAPPAWHNYMKGAVKATERGDYAQAESLLRSASKEADKSKEKIWKVITLNQLGLLFQEQDEYEIRARLLAVARDRQRCGL